jgi:methylated-DNA-[protein]-cysteine S-methyltransferase
MTQFYFKKILTPVGELRLAAHDHALVAVAWENSLPYFMKDRMLIQQDEHEILCLAEKQLNEYFLKQRQVFELPIQPFGTEFQRSVWNALSSIPFGESRTYKQIAEQIGNVKAVRAVGLANGKNPIAIIVPCHRVIGANGKLVGFAGGLENKQKLLQLEDCKW